jgi:hypothetical protein
MLASHPPYHRLHQRDVSNYTVSFTLTTSLVSHAVMHTHLYRCAAGVPAGSRPECTTQLDNASVPRCMLGSHPLLDHRLNQRNLIGSQISSSGGLHERAYKGRDGCRLGSAPCGQSASTCFSSFQVVPQDGKHLRGSSLLADSPSTARLTTS